MTVIHSRPFFPLGDSRVSNLYTLKNDAGMEVELSEYGASIVAIRVPDRSGQIADVVLGYDSLEGYRSRKYFLGATVGRCANRIAGGRFALNGQTYQLACNEKGITHLHGGNEGFDVQLWQSEIAREQDSTCMLRMRHFSPHLDEGYPGNLRVTVTFSLTEQNELVIRYEAISDADTLCNLTNHSYFNLAGHNTGDILSHELCIHADYFTPADENSIPTGKLLPVEGTPMDFRDFHAIKERIDDEYSQLHYASGYDHNYLLRKGNERLRPAAELWHLPSGRYLTCLTTSPCIQLYTGNFIDGTQKGKWGTYYPHRAGLCLETQFAPDAIHQPDWETPILRAGELFDHTTVYRFGVR